MRARPPLYQRLPSIPGGYELNPLRGFFEVVIPEATTNLVANPSVERNTTGHTASNGSSVARSATRQRRGVYSLQVTPSSNVNSGTYYAVTGLTTTQVYTFSVDVWGAPGVPYRIAITDSSANILNRLEFRGEGRWRRYSVNATPGVTSVRLYVEKNSSASTAVFYTDGYQLEAKAYPTTYCDGDQRGFVVNRQDYLWAGQAHTSASSRSAQCRAGGRVMNLSRFGFQLLGYLGLGLLAVAHAAVPSGQQGGSYYQGSIDVDRTFSLQGRFTAASLPQLQRDMADFEDAVRHGRVVPDQPLIFRYQVHDELEPMGDVLELAAVYQGGLEGTTANLHAEEVSPTFTMYMPYIVREGDAGASLAYQEALSNVGYLAYRSSGGGDWSPLDGGAGPNGLVSVIKRNPVNGLWYIGGGFTSVSGIANTNGIVSWNQDTGAYAAVGTGMNNTVYDLAFDSAGNVIAVGLFTTAGGGAANRIAKFTIATSTWSTFGTGLDAGALAVAVDINNTIYVTGDFANANGVARARIVKIDSSGNFSTMGTGLPDTGRALLIGPDGTTLYIGGEFANAGGVANTAFIAKWNGSTYVSLSSTALNNNVNELLLAPDNTILIGGQFTSPGSRIVRYNGVAYYGLDATLASNVESMALDPNDGTLYAVGLLTGASGYSLPYSATRWNGSVMHPLDIVGPGGSAGVTAYAIGIGPDGTIIAGLDGAVTTGIGAGTTTITNTGTAEAAPTFVITGPGTLNSIRNVTTGKELLFKGLTLLSGEIAELRLTPRDIAFSSNFRPNLMPYILEGSDLATWRLLAGTNVVSAFIYGSTDANTALAMRWRDHFGSVAGGTP